MKQIACLLAVLTMAIPGSSHAAVTVTMEPDYEFYPSTLILSARGDADARRVVWDNDDVERHRPARPGFQGWTSPVLDPGESWSRVFKYAGKYLYACAIHTDQSMTGRVYVRPWAGSDGDTTVEVGEIARVRVGAEAPRNGIVFDIKKKSGLHGEWKVWRRGVDRAWVSYTPPSTTDRFFSARLRRLSDGATTGWSLSTELNVV